MDRAFVLAFIFVLALIAFAVWIVSPAHAHSWYSHRHDPVTQIGCCGGTDCAQLVIEPGVLVAEADGYRLRLTLEQARRIRPTRLDPVDTLIPWARVQDSEDGNYHLCLPQQKDTARDDFFCFFAPPNT